MALTFGQARLILAEYAQRGGLCPEDERVELFVLEVLQYLLFKGPSGALRSYCFQATEGCITIPYELEVPLKVKINNAPGSVWSQWFKYYDTGYLDGHCLEASNALAEESNTYPTIYNLPPGGSKVGVVAVVNEAQDANLIVKGLDPTGREIFTFHQGEQISGEYLSIKKGQLIHTQATFGKITDIVKTETNGYCQLIAYNPVSRARKFLADYSPFETIPQYRRFKLTVRCQENAVVNVLGRIRLKSKYADNDVIPFDNIHLLKVAAQGVQLEGNNDVQAAKAKDEKVDNLLDDENKYKKVSSGQPLNTFFPTSGGAIQNIVQGRNFKKWW